MNYLTNSSGLKQVYQYDKAKKQTFIKEYDNGKYVKGTKCDYDEKLVVKTNMFIQTVKPLKSKRQPIQRILTEKISMMKLVNMQMKMGISPKIHMIKMVI